MQGKVVEMKIKGNLDLCSQAMMNGSFYTSIF
jgi:hypothetical protein